MHNYFLICFWRPHILSQATDVNKVFLFCFPRGLKFCQRPVSVIPRLLIWFQRLQILPKATDKNQRLFNLFPEGFIFRQRTRSWRARPNARSARSFCRPRTSTTSTPTSLTRTMLPSTGTSAGTVR